MSKRFHRFPCSEHTNDRYVLGGVRCVVRGVVGFRAQRQSTVASVVAAAAAALGLFETVRQLFLLSPELPAAPASLERSPRLPVLSVIVTR